MSSPAKQTELTQLWYTRCPLPAASGIAQRFRWLHQAFAAQGIKLDTIRTSPDRAVRDSHFTHAQPGLFREGGPVPPLWARALGRETALVGITRIDEAQAVLVRSDSALDTLEDLHGKRLALPRHATQYADHARAQTLHRFTEVLARAGLSPRDVAFIDIDEGEYEIREPPVAVNQTQFPVLDALLEGRVDAVYASGARIGRFAAGHGLRALREDPADAATAIRYRPGAPRPITVNRDLAIDHPRIVARYLAVLQQTAAWAAANPDRALSVITAEIGGTEAANREGYGPNLHRQLDVKLSADYLSALEGHKNFLRDNGFLTGDFDFQDWIVSEPLALAEQIVASEDLALAV